MFNSSNDKVNNVHKVPLKVLCTFLTLALVITGFIIPVSAGQYTDHNRSNYHLANWYGLDELPYGNDSGVVYLKTYNGTKWVDLTICFNKCTPLVEVVGSLGSVTNTDGSQESALIDNFTYSHIWGLKSGAVSNGNSFFFSCISDTPVYYTYGNTGEDWKTLPWSYVSQAVYTTQTRFSSDGSGGEVSANDSAVKRYRTVYCYLDIDLGKYGFSIPSDTRWWCYSNKLMTNNVSDNYKKDYRNLYAISFNTPQDSKYNGNTSYNLAKTDVTSYAYCCYPSSECLRDWTRWDQENSYYQLFFQQLNAISNMQDQMFEQLQYISEDTLEIKELLKNIASGGKDYPSYGLLNDKTYSDQVDGVMGDIKTDTSSSQYIANLSASFIVIRGIWDKIVNTFGFAPVIGLLLFLAFVAYLLGRALKGRSD